MFSDCDTSIADEECDHDMNIMMIIWYLIIVMVVRILFYFMIISNLTIAITIIIVTAWITADDLDASHLVVSL